MPTVIPFPGPKGGPPEHNSTSEKRVELVDRVATMEDREVEQISGLASREVEVEWINPDADVGITHRIGAVVFRRVRTGARILQCDDIGVVTIPWIQASFRALTQLQARWNGSVTMVWNLVRQEGRTEDNPELAGAWRDMVRAGSPIERIIIVQNFEHPSASVPEWSIDEPVVVVYPQQLDEVLDRLASAHKDEAQSS
jgi:hypothetical protein